MHLLHFPVAHMMQNTEIDTLAASPQLIINEQVFGLASKLITGFDYTKKR